MTDQQRRLQGCFGVFHSALVILREECKDNADAMVIVDDLEFHLLTRIRTLRHRMYVPYEHFGIDYGDGESEMTVSLVDQDGNLIKDITPTWTYEGEYEVADE